MSTQLNKEYVYKKIVALRKALQLLEEELGYIPPALPKRRAKIRQHFEENYALGTWRKPEELKKKRTR